MAQIVVRIRPKDKSGSPYVDRHRYGRGDVIEVLPDSHVFSAREASNPDWRIVQVPGVDPVKLLSLVARDVGYADPAAEKASRVLRRRAFCLDLAALKALTDSPVTRAELLGQPKKAEAHALSLIRAAPLLDDPAVIGGALDSRVIG